jgi:hypothetical protein
MTIELDAGHWSLLAVIAMMLIAQVWISWLVKKERHDLTLKMMASKGDGTLDTYVAGKKTLEEAPREETSLEEAQQVLDDFEERDSVEVY